MFQPPEPFTLHPRKSPLTTPWEPLYADIRADRWVLGVEIREPHTNSRGAPHGGLIAALADNAMGLSAVATFARLYLLPVKHHALPSEVRVAPAW